MRKFFTVIVALIITLSATAKRTYWYNGDYWNTYAIGIGYSHFNEANMKNCYNFHSNQINMFAVIYGIYVDATISPSQWSPNDGQRLGNWGMDFGYMIPLMKRNSREFRIYIGPIGGFQNVGKWCNQYTYYNIYRGPYTYTCTYCSSHFHNYNSYFDFGGVAAISYKNLWLQFKATRTTIGGSIGFCF